MRNRARMYSGARGEDSLRLGHSPVNRIEVNFHFLTGFVLAVDLVASAGLFEFPDLVPFGFFLFFEIIHAHPLFFGLVGAILLCMGGE